MAKIYQFPTPIPMTNGNFPQFKFAVFGDNLAAITTAGYLNSSSSESGIPLSNADVIMCLYSFSQVTTTGTFGIFTVNIATSTGQITLSEWTGTSGVVLPTIANHIATYTNTTGTLSEDPATAISGGNIQAGLSGTAGTLASFPGTASKGSLVVAAVANTGNTVTTISNAAMGQASVVSIPDPGTATADFAVAPAALVNGNLIQASGTAGLIADSGIAASSLAVNNLPQIATVSFTSANITGMYATPVQILAAPGAGKINIIETIQWDYAFSTAAYTAGGLITAQYGNTAHAGGTIATLGIPAATLNGLSASGQLNDVATSFGAANTVVENAAIYMSNATQAFASGSGTVTLYIRYRTITPA